MRLVVILLSLVLVLRFVLFFEQFVLLCNFSELAELFWVLVLRQVQDLRLLRWIEQRSVELAVRFG